MSKRHLIAVACILARGLTAAVLSAVMLLVPALPGAYADLWVEDGIPVSDAVNNQNQLKTVPDGEGGMFLAWRDYSAGQRIFAQHIDTDGNPLWTPGGVMLCTVSSWHGYPDLAADGSGGVFVAWQDYRDGATNIYAQRVGSDGDLLWGAGGVAVCLADDNQGDPRVAADGFGGMLVAWEDIRNGSNYDIYAQRINGSGVPQWIDDGVQLCSSSIQQIDCDIIPNYTGGAIVVWEASNATADIYGQYVDGDGTIEWGANGVAVGNDITQEVDPVIVEDGTGGGIVAWDAGTDIWIARLSGYSVNVWGSPVQVAIAYGTAGYHTIIPDGNHGAFVGWVDNNAGQYSVEVMQIFYDGNGWGPTGVPMCSTTQYKAGVALATDDDDNLYVAWYETRNLVDYDIIVQRYDLNELTLWEPDGVVACGAMFNQESPGIVPDGTGGALVAWMDRRSYTDYDIYAQRIENGGNWGYPSASISGVRDVPGDEGGWLNLSWDASRLDILPENEITGYSVWRAIDPVAAMMILGEEPERLVDTGAPFCVPSPGALRMETLGGTTYYWDYLLTVPSSLYTDTYSKQVPSMFDSTATATEYQYFQIIAHTADSLLFWVSEPDSGRSVDNLAPVVPLGFSGEQSYSPAGIQLTWDPNDEPDLSGYRIYRGFSEDFTPGSENLLTSVPDTCTFDGGWTWESGYYYKLAAVDVHGNESGYALLSPAGLTGDDIPDTPNASYLSQNYPNPFNPSTTIAFGLSRASRVKLAVYDPAGRLVRVLIDEDRGPGRYAASWDGLTSLGQRAASGIYFYRIAADGFVETRKMVLMR